MLSNGRIFMNDEFESIWKDAVGPLNRFTFPEILSSPYPKKRTSRIQV
jgi:hypothetical protein